MKKLSQFLDNTADTQRIERKFLLRRGQCLLAERSLKRGFFKKKFANRKVNSIYFDDINFSALRDNIDGNPYRDKLRVRWYNNTFEKATIEIKHKRNIIGYKTSIPIIGHKTEDDLINAVCIWIRYNVSEQLFPTSQVQYHRTYYVNSNFRATVDRNIQSFRRTNGKLISPKNINYEVVELKYALSDDDIARDLIGKLDSISLRATKSSKYANSIMDFNIPAY